MTHLPLSWYEGAGSAMPSEPPVVSAREKAIFWARELLKAPFVVVDFETTGIGPGAEIVQIGVIDQSARILMDCLVKPSRRIPEAATAVHGITNEMVAEKDTFAFDPGIIEGIDIRLARHLSRVPVVAYNASFEQSMLKNEWGDWPRENHRENHRENWEPIDWQCAMENFAAFYGEESRWKKGFNWKSLSFAASHLRVEQSGAHSAVADCLTTLAVIKAMAVS